MVPFGPVSTSFAPARLEKKTTLHVSVVTPCYNEEDNVRELVSRIRAEFEKLPEYSYEHIFIDNASKDSTVETIKGVIREDSRVRLIVNSRNFGHIRSPHHAILQASGDAVIVMASDLQDPPDMIPRLLAAWRKGFLVVKAVRATTDETPLMAFVRSLFYWVIAKISDLELTKNYTGAGLYDRRVIEILREIDDPYPYFRGLISEIGFDYASVVFHQAARKRGISANNFYTLYDLAMLGITKHSRVPLRLMTIVGFASAAIGFLVGFGFLVMKLLYWYEFDMGQAPLLLGVFFSFSLQMFFMGILGEYVGNIFTQIQKTPLVVEKERFNMSEAPSSRVPSALSPNIPLDAILGAATALEAEQAAPLDPSALRSETGD
jgi:polyisoprenyl-phosphate glycosyltransferase